MVVLDGHFSGRDAFRDARNDERVRANHDWRHDSSESDPRTFRSRQSFTADLKFAARNRRGRRYFEDLRASIR
jgi:hypothetical protein